ncbi:S1 family peptidase [Candidatus Electrothrix sp.]|uniref:S1 family peptidase n=1 Tax=Candidatus Electrothrix sp. TaxID=2170559 RepID=UPI00405607DF
MKLYVMFCWFVFSIVLWCGTSLGGNNIEFLDKALIQKLNHGIYEVVTPKLEDEKITYARKLPFEKLDYVEREEKYHSIGTAFFINEKELMTAEHVFDLKSFSLKKEYFIRDAEGKVYPVGKVHKCSTRRDLLVLDLQKYPEHVIPLNINRKVEIGDTVFSAGNALGEGISYRAGQVASFTPERIYGEWQDIRFTSPASPGNSGGPLLNTEGEVVGVVVQRRNSSENYNVAVPISELDKLGTQAEFHARNVSVVIEGTSESLIRDWAYQVPLPATLEELTQKAQKSLGEFYRELRKQLTEKVKEKNFPRSQRFRFYLRNQPVIQGFASIQPDVTFRKWTARSQHLTKEPLAEKQSVFHAQTQYFDMQAIIEKPVNVELKSFLDSPRMILETLLAATPYFRQMGTDKVRLTGLGEPVETEAWQDNLGRKWRSSLWYVPYIDYFIYMHCLPYPNGAICNLLDDSTSLLGLDHFASVQEGADELVVGYEGSLGDWEEFLSLGEKYLPSFFDQAEIIGKKRRAEIRLKDFQMNFDHPEIAEDTSLRLHLGYANNQLLSEDLVMLTLFPVKGRPLSYTVRPYYEPSPFSSDAYRGIWEEVISGTGDFSGEKTAQGNRLVVQRSALQTEKTITDPDGEKIQKIFTVGCTYKASIAEEKDVEQDCERFFQSIQFTDT